MTQAQLADLAGMSRSTVNRHEQQSDPPDAGARSAYARAFGISLAALDARMNEARSTWIPLAVEAPDGSLAPAATGGGAMSTVEMVDAAGIDRPDSAFAVRIAGRAMEPTLLIGDVVVFRWIDVAHVPIPDGAVVLVRFTREAKRGESLVCRWSMLPDGRVRLTRDNPAYPAMEWPRDAIQQVGVFVELRRRHI